MRTFCREEGARNAKASRIHQALKFYQLTQLFHQRTGISVEDVHVEDNHVLREFLAKVDWTFTALMADSIGNDPVSSRVYPAGFLLYPCFADAVRAMSRLFPVAEQALTLHHLALLLKGTAVNLRNHSALLQQALQGQNVDVVIAALEQTAASWSVQATQSPLSWWKADCAIGHRRSVGTDLEMEGACGGGSRSELAAIENMIRRALELTAIVEAGDPANPYASAGLLFIRKQVAVDCFRCTIGL
jgi:hypothetical protein